MSNPYQAPEVQDVQAIPAANAEAVAIRRFHISHEASVRGVGSLYIVGGILVLFGAISGLQATPVHAMDARTAGSFASNSLFPVVGIVAGFGLRKLFPWARVTTIVLSVFSLLSLLFAALATGAFLSGKFVPILVGASVVALINLYVIYLMVSAKGKVVFSSDYKGVIALTPEIKYRSKFFLIFLLIILALIVFGVLAAVFIRF